MKKSILILLVMFSLSAAAQDFVVTMKNDTIRGKVYIYGYDVIDRIQAVVDKKKTNLTAVEVKSVQIDGKKYKPVKSPQGFRMMQVAREGQLGLYLARRPQSNDYDLEYLVKANGEAMEVPNISFKKIMTRFLNDCEAIGEKIEKEDLGRKNLDLIISDYNICIVNQTKAAMGGTIYNPEDPKLTAISALKEKIEKSQISTKKDALDILVDITGKVKNNEKIPNYLVDGLKSGLKDAPDLQPELDKVLSLIQTN